MILLKEKKCKHSCLPFVLQKNDNWDWWSCAPTIKACFTDPGVMEVFWEEPNAIQKKLIKGYQVQAMLKRAIPVKISQRGGTTFCFFLTPSIFRKKITKNTTEKTFMSVRSMSFQKKKQFAFHHPSQIIFNGIVLIRVFQVSWAQLILLYMTH